MDLINRSVAVIYAALALALPLPTHAIELTQRRIDDAVMVALLQEGTRWIVHGLDRSSDVNSQRPVRPANLMRKLDWAYDAADWYLQQQEKGRLSGSEAKRRVPDRYRCDERLVR